MASLEMIDRTKRIDINPYQQHLDKAIFSPVDGLQSITIEGDDVEHFLDWASCDTWRQVIESDLQPLANDLEGKPLLDAFIPLVTFRYQFCVEGRQIQDDATQKLMDRLYTATREWRDAGCDLVDIAGYQIVKGEYLWV